ncbi:DUF6252 family protein [Pontimicrobium sp. MEBiC01747]|jgi:hypothetical protein
MKKFIVLVLTIFTFLGCGEELEFNTPSFQAKKDGNLWEAITYSANIDASGVLTIVGSDNFETVTLVSNSAALGLHDMVNTSSSGALLDVNSVVWSTNNMPDPSVQIYPADGVIDIKEVDTEGGTVSGEFYFNAFNASGLSSINFNRGFFHKVQLVGTPITGGVSTVSCAQATATVDATFLSFDGTATTDANYETVCNAYKTALQTKITACGDTDGSIQTTIDGLTCM